MTVCIGAKEEKGGEGVGEGDKARWKEKVCTRIMRRVCVYFFNSDDSIFLQFVFSRTQSLFFSLSPTPAI